MKQKLPNTITILVLTVLTVIVWVSLSIYRAFKTGVSPSVPTEVSQDLSPTLDKNTIESINGRLFINEVPVQILQTPSPIPSPAASPIITTASPSGTLEGGGQESGN